MALNFLLKRSGTADKRPDPSSMALGELDLNYDATTGGVFYKDSAGDVVKVGSAQVSATAPNATPVGSAGNSTGEFWYDTSTSALKMWDGTAWVATGGGGGGGVAGVTGTAPITVDNTDPANPIVGVDAASTLASGVVQLNDTTSSTSTTEAATANAVKSAFDAATAAQATADAALPKAGGTMTGDIVFNAGQTFAGTVSEQDFQAKGDLVSGYGVNTFGIVSVGADGQVLSANSACASGLEWITAGGGSGTVTSVTAGTGLTGGTITTSGTIALDTACVIAPSAFTAKGDILAASAAATPAALPVGADGQFLVADSTCTTGLAWTSDIAPVAITDCTGGTGTAGQVLSSTGTALEWVDAGGGGGGSQASPTALGTVYGYTPDATVTTGACRESVIIGYSSLPFFPPSIGSVVIGYDTARGAASGLTNGSVIIGCNIGTNFFNANDAVVIGSNAAAAIPTNQLTDNSVIIGSGAGRCSAARNVYVGAGAGSCTVGVRNTAVGCGALKGAGAVTSCMNVAIGDVALNTTGQANTALGVGAGNSGTSITGNNNTFIGFSATALNNACSNHITLGNSQITTIRAAVTTITSLSDARDKTDIVALPIGLDFVNALNPVKFTWQQREPNEVKDGTSEMGFIAQDFQAVEEDFATQNFTHLVEGTSEKLEASPGKLIPVLVKAIQELSAKNDALEARLAALEGN